MPITKEKFNRLKEGDEDAWRDFYKLVSPKLRRLANGRLDQYDLAPSYADDIIQTVFIDFKKRLDKGVFTYKGQQQLQSFLYQSVTLRIYELVKVRKKEPVPLSDKLSLVSDKGDEELLEDLLFRLHQFEESPEEILHRKAKREQVREILLPILDKALRELSDRDRNIVLRHLVSRQKQHQIAKQMKLPAPTVYRVVQRAKQTIKSYYLAAILFRGGKNNEL